MNCRDPFVAAPSSTLVIGHQKAPILGVFCQDPAITFPRQALPTLQVSDDYCEACRPHLPEARITGSPSSTLSEDFISIRSRSSTSIAIMRDWPKSLPPSASVLGLGCGHGMSATLIHKVALTLKSGGRFLFTAPHQVCEWPDNLTGRKSVSLGSDAYCKIVELEGWTLVGEAKDKGQNHSYFVY